MAMREGDFLSFFDECFGCLLSGIPRSKTGRRIMAFKGCVGDNWIKVAFLPSDVLCFFWRSSGSVTIDTLQIFESNSSDSPE